MAINEATQQELVGSHSPRRSGADPLRSGSVPTSPRRQPAPHGWRWPILVAMIAMTVLVALIASGSVSAMVSW